MAVIASIHQPAYLPWLGYFHKISRSDIHIFYDDAEYSKNNLFNRNKIKTRDGAQWLTVPVQYRSTHKINQIKIAAPSNWKAKHWKAVSVNYARAPYFNEYKDFFAEFYQKDWSSLSELCIEMNKGICDLLGIKTKFFLSSDLSTQGKSNEKLVNICKAVGADTYLCGRGAKESYLDEDMFAKENIAVKIQEFAYPAYSQLWGEFIPNLSVIDVMFNCGPETATYL